MGVNHVNSVNPVMKYVFNSQWAYGVTCWEIFTTGSIPYPGLHPMTMIKQLDSGLRLEKPKNSACSEDMYVDKISLQRLWKWSNNGKSFSFQIFTNATVLGTRSKAPPIILRVGEGHWEWTSRHVWISVCQHICHQGRWDLIQVLEKKQKTVNCP